MNESPNKTKLEIQYDILMSNKDRVFSPTSKTWEFTKKSTQGSYNINNEINQTQNSDQNILDENKFKTENNLVKIEYEKNSEGNQKKFSKFDIKIDYRNILKLRNSSSMNISAHKNKIFDNKYFNIKKESDPNEQNHFSLINNKKISESSIKINKKIRTDAYGAPIIKNNRKFRVTFVDLLQNRDDIKDGISKNDKNLKNMNYKKNREDSINFMSKLNANLYQNHKNIGIHNKKGFNRKFIEEIKIKSYKMYNIQTKEDDKQRANCSSCFCVIF